MGKNKNQYLVKERILQGEVEYNPQKRQQDDNHWKRFAARNQISGRTY